ncbi:MAG: nitrate reductase, partial [Acinetobacter sp.]
IVRSLFSTHIRRGQIFVPIHWNDQVASDARIGAVVNPVVDAVSGEPEFKHTPVMIQPFYGRWQGVLYLRHELQQAVDLNDAFTWWVKIQTPQAVRVEIVDRLHSDDVLNKLQNILPFDPIQDEWLIYQDQHLQTLHLVLIRHDRLMAAFYLAPRDFLPDREWVAGLFNRQRLSALQRRALLAGMPIGQGASQGALVCSCFKVGKNTIVNLIQSKNITDEKQVTACLKAGGNCGSCLPEIRGLIKQCQAERAV